MNHFKSTFLTQDEFLSQMLSPEAIRSQLCFRLIHEGRNREMLRDLPYHPFLDLAAIYYWKVSHPQLGPGFCLLHYDLLKPLGLQETELWSLALSNIMRLQPPCLHSLQELLTKMLTQAVSDQSAATEEEFLQMGQFYAETDTHMYVLSNPDCYFGAACLLYPDVLHAFAEKQNSDLYLLPSSIHEFLLIPAKYAPDPRSLNQMVKSVNQEEVPFRDQLSDHVYLYHHTTGKITM